MCRVMTFNSPQFKTNPLFPLGVLVVTPLDLRRSYANTRARIKVKKKQQHSKTFAKAIGARRDDFMCLRCDKLSLAAELK